MTPSSRLCLAATFAALTLTPVAVLAQENGPCTDDIAKLRRELSTQVGLGAPISEPDYGQQKGPNDTAGGRSAADTTGSTAKPGSPETDRAQPGGASRESGGSPGTVGGVSGPTGPTGQADGVASGRVATSPDDVRRQSENRPTAAAAAAKGGDAKAAPELGSEDKVSQAKMALQRAIDLNAKGDRGCATVVNEARELMPQKQGG